MTSNLDRCPLSASLSDLFHFRKEGPCGRYREKTNPCSYKNQILVPALTSAWCAVTYKAPLPTQHYRLCHENKSADVQYVEHEQPSYVSSSPSDVLYVITCNFFRQSTTPTLSADTVTSMAVVTPAITFRRKRSLL